MFVRFVYKLCCMCVYYALYVLYDVHELCMFSNVLMSV